MALTLVLLVVVVFMEQGQRRIPVTFAKRVVGRRMYGGSSTYIPLKVNQSGVIPIIFANSLLYIPVLLANVIPWAGFRTFVNNHITPTSLMYVVVLRPPDLRLHVLLRLRGLRPPPAGRHHPQAGRVHPRHPARPADREATWHAS